MLEVTLLGTGGMMPLKNRALASAIVRHQGACVLLDCGEGTQVRIHDCGYSFKSIAAILLTHFHADHVSGLPGLLLSMSNQGRTEKVRIAGPTGVKTVVNALRIIAPRLPFEIEYIEIDPSAPEGFALAGLEIAPFALEHGVDCVGYRIHLPRAGRFLPERARAAGVPLKLWSALQRQPAVEMDGRVFTREMVMTPPRHGITVVYATDTRPVPAIADAGRDAELMILEGMYGAPEKESRAREVGHMMISEAAQLAASAHAHRLWLTHFSPAMPEPEAFMESARAIFPAAKAGTDGLRACLRFED